MVFICGVKKKKVGPKGISVSVLQGVKKKLEFFKYIIRSKSIYMRGRGKGKGGGGRKERRLERRGLFFVVSIFKKEY